MASVPPLVLYPMYRTATHRVYVFANGSARVFRDADGHTCFLRGAQATDLTSALDRLGYCDQSAELLASLEVTLQDTGQGDLFDYR